MWGVVEGVQLLERSGQLPPTPSTPPGGRPRTAQQHPLVRTSLTPRSPLAGGWCESPLAQRCCRAFSSSWWLRSSTAGPATETSAVEIGGPPSTAQAGARAKMGAAWRACTSTASVAASRSTALRRQNAAASQTSTPAMRSTSCCRSTLEAGLAALPTSTCATFVDA